MRRPITCLAASVLLVPALSGCGNEAESTPSAESSAPAQNPAENPAKNPAEDPSSNESATKKAAGSGTKYCELVGTDFTSLFASIQGPGDVERAARVIKQIRAAAPPEVEDEWDRVRGALGDLEAGLVEGARLKKRAAAGKITARQMRRETTRLGRQMQSLNTPANARAGEVVAKHATRYCGVTLG